MIAKAKVLQLAKEKQWKDLLHIRPNIFGLKRSQITDPHFFLSPEGSKNPEVELEATLEALLTPQDLPPDKHPLCYFPARKSWLSEKLQINNELFPKVNCKLYDSYIRRLNAESVSVVFSSYYPNNPGSVFGHTLFRINKKLAVYERSNELLDHGIGYAANANIDNPALYALYGLFGGFKGIFTIVPYYYKVREYNDFESRSLWSYDLNLSPSEVQLLVDHLWEVGFTYFDYYFFTQNCGFHMLTVLEAAAPRLRVVENISFWVIPSDAVKVITEEPDLIKKVSYRPSVEEKFYKRWNQLTDTEKNQLRHWNSTKSLQGIETLNNESKKNVLDTMLDYFDYKNPNILSEGHEAQQKERNALLQARAQILSASNEVKIEPPTQDRPDVGHESGRLGLRFGTNVWNKNPHQQESYQELQVRFALHDLLDAPWSYPPGAHIEFMNFRFRYWQKSPSTFLVDRTQLEEFTLFRLFSLFPRDEFHRSPSWNFAVTSKRIYDHHCTACMAGGIEGGAGGTWNFSDDKISLFTFLNSSLLYSSQFQESHWLWSAGPQVGALYRLGDFNMKFTADTKWFLENGINKAKETGAKPSQELEIRHNYAKDWSWGLRTQFQPEQTKYEFQWYRFF